MDNLYKKAVEITAIIETATCMEKEQAHLAHLAYRSAIEDLRALERQLNERLLQIEESLPEGALQALERSVRYG